MSETRVAIKRNVIQSGMPISKATITNVMVKNLGPKGIEETGGCLPRWLRLLPDAGTLTSRSAMSGDPFCKNIKIVIVRAALRWKITTGPLI